MCVCVCVCDSDFYTCVIAKSHAFLSDAGRDPSQLWAAGCGLKQNRNTSSMTAQFNWAREFDSRPQFKFFVQEVTINLARIDKGSTASSNNGQSGCRKSQPKTKAPAKPKSLHGNCLPATRFFQLCAPSGRILLGTQQYLSW